MISCDSTVSARGASGAWDAADPARAAEGARVALASPWHAVALGGPAAGLVAAVPARGTLGRDQFPDPAMSRVHLRLDAHPGRVRVADAGSTNGTFRRKRKEWRPLRRRARWPEGAELHAGGTRLGLARRPVVLEVPLPDGSGRRGPARLLALPLLITLPLILFRYCAPAAWALLAVLGGLGAGLATRWWRRRALPAAPAHLLLTAAAGPAGSPPPRADQPLRAWMGTSKWRRRPLAVGPAERVCLIGPRAAECARWVAGQWACAQVARVSAGQRRFRAPEDAPALALVPPGDAAGGEAAVGDEMLAGRALTWAARVADAPAWATRLVAAPPTVPEASEAWWEALYACLADRAAAGDGGVPERVLIADHVARFAGLERLSEAAMSARWRGMLAESTPPDLRAWLGRTASVDLEVDLVADGPHALVAGTTGSGKSEALVTWLMSLALRYPPSQVGFVLVDYKGGETCGQLAGLPHVAGVVTDLDPAATRRGITSLAAELARRERLRAAGQPIGRRLVVVVDEFRRVAEDEPDLLATLVRIATIGRSLGVHVILATQRPAGIVDAHMRANLPFRLCLRVLEDADSHDVVGSAQAAHLPRIPGRALVAGGGVAQIGWCGPAGTVAGWVAMLARAWEGLGGPPAAAPWAPALPDALGWESRLDLPRCPLAQGESATPTRVVGWRDRPEQQRLDLFGVPGVVAALVVGSPGSGRSGVARALANALAEDGFPIHAVTSPGQRWPEAASSVATSDIGAVWELLDAAENVPGVVVIDGCEGLFAEADRALGAGVMADRLAQLARRAGPTAHLVVTVSPPDAASRWTQAMRQRVICPTRGGIDAAHIGLPENVCALADRPGRVVWCEGATRALVQVALPPEMPPPTGPALVASLPAQPDRTSPRDIGVISPLATPLPVTAHRRWLVIAAAGPAREGALDVLHSAWRAQRVTAVDVDLNDAAARIPEGDEPIIAVVGPAKARAAYTGDIVTLRESAGVLAFGNEADLRHLVPAGYAHVAYAGRRRDGWGVYVGGGEAHNIQLFAPSM
ncbi:MAG: FtsK/SpoIIIE domain-containing protein [Actinomycetaceae bacterium]|nr:FtsK/SpoIIIE domain-containing protein [Actinomycetaceae bacterium]MDU0970487.1 FtsK/SpoIIIE domain-containing protein [Actinomycetaceae bacterium]